MTDCPAPTDVAIIGAGIAGCASAYYLAKRGLDVVVVDKGAIGFEQSTRNWGWVHQQVRYPHLIPLAIESVRIWHTLADELGADVEFVPGGNLSLGFDDADLADLEAVGADAATAGLDSEMLSAGQVRELLPGSVGRWTGALHIPSDGQANPDLVTAAFARAAEALGARIVSNCAALDVDTTAGAVSGLITERGVVRTARVLCAAGAWSARFARRLGVRFPQRAVRGTVVRTAPTDPVTDLTAWGDGFTFRQDRQGRFILASGARAVYDIDLDLLRDVRQFAPLAWKHRRWVRVRAGRPLLNDLAALIPGSAARREFWQRRRAIDPPPVAASVRASLDGFRAMFPALANVEIESTWAGQIDSTPDQAPILDTPAGGPDGFYLATGLSGHGFALGPAAAKLVAELIVGDDPSVDPRPFRHARFAEGDLPSLRPYPR